MEGGDAGKLLKRLNVESKKFAQAANGDFNGTGTVKVLSMEIDAQSVWKFLWKSPKVNTFL